MSILNQLVDIYLNEEWWHKVKLPRETALSYTQKLLDQGCIFCVTKKDRVIGYSETWRLDYEQFGRIIATEPFYADSENVTEGPIAMCANVWIDKRYRRNGVIDVLKYQFFRMNEGCKYFVGEAKRKKTGLVKVFNREEFRSKLKLKDDE